MKFKVNAGVIGQQTIIESVKDGNVLVSSSDFQNMIQQEKSDLVGQLLASLKEGVLEIDEAILKEESKERIRLEITRLEEEVESSDDISNVSIRGLLDALNESLGSLAGIFGKSIQLAQFFGFK